MGQWLRSIWCHFFHKKQTHPLTVYDGGNDEFGIEWTWCSKCGTAHIQSVCQCAACRAARAANSKWR